MAAVYSTQDGCVDKLKPENEKHVVDECSADSVGTDKMLEENVELSGGVSAVKAGEHTESPGTNPTVSAIVIKEEPLEDSEYVTVHLDKDGEDESEGETVKSSDFTCKDESTGGDWPFHCEKSSDASGNKDAYVEQRQDHTHDGPIVCLDADSQCDNLLVSTGEGHRMLCCAICGREFSSSRGFFNHQLKHRNQAIKQESVLETTETLARQKIFECKDCGKAYASIGQVLNHQRSHKQASKSVFHQLAHLKKKSFQCPTCGRCYSRASALDAHRRCHEVKLFKFKNSEAEKHQPDNDVTIKAEEETTVNSEEVKEPQKKLFECYCGKSFRTMGGLGTHQRFSANCSNTQVKVRVKPSFECTECGKSFDSSLAVACHQRWHKRRADKSQKFECEECGKHFTSLTFYSKHQRLVHSEDLASKSFLNQVCQLQKKTFECQDCGCRFSRASALHSHQLCHTDIFSDILEGSSKTTSTGQSVNSHQLDHDEDGSFVVDGKDYSQDALVTKKKSPSEGANDGCRSDQGSQNDEKQDLELVCESDEDETQLSKDVHFQPMNPDMNVNIIQVDDPPFKDDPVNTEAGRSPPQEAKKYECPDCHRTFVKAISLRCHMLWHKDRMGKKSRYRRKIRILNPIRKVTLTCETCGHESFSKTDYYFHLRKHEDRKPYKSISYQLAHLQKNSFKCEVCGMQFSRASALNSHQQHHKKQLYECLQCDKSYSSLSSLHNHQNICSGKDLSYQAEKARKMKNLDPNKTLLGPKVHHCKKCGKGFWSMGAYYHHRQYNPQCAEVKMSSSTPSEDEHVKHRKRGRKKGKRRGRYNIQSRTLYKCDVCDKSYRVVACFLKHQLVHSTAPPVKAMASELEHLSNSYSCPYCGKLFSRAMALQFHMKSHGHEAGLPVEKRLSRAFAGPQCRKCLVFFSCESALQIHRKHCTMPRNEMTQPLEMCLKNEKEGPKASQEIDDQTQNGEAPNTVGPEKLDNIQRPDLKYKCNECDKSYSVVGALNFHKRIHSHDLISKEAKPEFANVPSPKFSQQAVGANFYCSECGRRFFTNSALGTHRRWHKDKKLARFLLKSSKIFRKSIDNGPFVCNLCGKGFFYLCVLRRHQKYHPPLEAQSHAEPILPTTERNATYSKGKAAHQECNQSGVVEPDHQDVEASDQPVKFASLSTTETVTASGTKPKIKYYCTQCNKNFSNSRGLRAHKWQKHKRSRGRPAKTRGSDVKPFPCSGCDKSYGSQASLQNHQRACSSIHWDPKLLEKTQIVEGPVSWPLEFESPAKCLFKCQNCGKVFSSEQQLDAHKEAARNRPYSCALCCRGYWTEPQLQQHLLWHDRVRSRLPTELRYRLNSSVASVASTKDQFFSANLVSHSKLPKFQTPLNCCFCPRTFMEISDFTAHQQRCLGDQEVNDSPMPLSPDAESLTCIECGISFTQESELHQHYIDHARGEL